MKLAFCCPDGPPATALAALASSLDAPLCTDALQLPEDCSHVLWADTAGLRLQARGDNSSPTRVDFLDPTLQYRLQTSGKRQGLGKAVGLDKAAGFQVLDATAGLGRDALVLAHLGCQVTLLEKSPLVHALLADGFRRAADTALAPTLARMHLQHADALDWFAAIARGEQVQPDVVYLDPMFPPRTGSAKVKKDIAMLQVLLGAEEDFATLLQAARDCARRRVVVKRPGRRVEGALPVPTFVVPGKSAHFEVYVNSSFSSMS